MNCLNCKQLGHTAAYCCNKARCGKCGEHHGDNSCKLSEKCLYCGETPHELSTCSAYIKRRDNIKRSLKERSKRSYADMLKTTVITSLISQNPFDLLPSEEYDSDDPQEGTSFADPGNSRKRKNSAAPKFPGKGPKISQSGMKNIKSKTKSAVEIPKQSPPGFNNLKSQKEFPKGVVISC